MKKKVFVHIDMDAFFAAVEQRDNQGLQGQPVVIGADPKGGGGRGVVSTCSYEARKFGIRSAMPISEAYHRCPQAFFLSGDMGKYRKISKEIFNILYDFTDLVEPVSIDEAFLDISGSYHFYQTPLKTCEEIRKRIKKDLRLNASIGIAPIKMVAKIASDLSKPDGLMEIQETQVLDFLWKLPINKIWGVGEKVKKALNAFGIVTIKDLAKTNVDFLYKNFGANGIHLHDLANGIDLREIELDREIKSVSHEHTFDRDTESREEIYEVFSFLSEKVSRRLRKLGLKGRSVSVKIRTSDFKTVTRVMTLSDRTNYYDVIFSNARGMFEKVFKGDKKIRLIGVRVSNFLNPYVMDSLFSDSLSERREKVHAAIDLIKDKFGEKSINRGLKNIDNKKKDVIL